MRQGLSQNTQLKQELKINPRLYQAMDLLYMPLLDLQQHLKQELLNNPFLEMVEPEEEDEEEGTETEEAAPQVEIAHRARAELRASVSDTINRACVARVSIVIWITAARSRSGAFHAPD